VQRKLIKKLRGVHYKKFLERNFVKVSIISGSWRR